MRSIRSCKGVNITSVQELASAEILTVRGKVHINNTEKFSSYFTIKVLSPLQERSLRS
jgi:hypothetical protein